VNAQREEEGSRGPVATLEPVLDNPAIEKEAGREEIDAVIGAEVAEIRRRGPWRTIKGVVSTIAAVILAAVAVLAAVVAVSTHFSAGGQIGAFGHPVMSVLSGSMVPAINTGDLVVDDNLTPTQAANLHVGQIISFRAAAGSHQIFTHRIIAVEALPGDVVAYVTKGDANDSRDGPLAPSTNVVGLYESKIPYGGYVLNALHRPLVLGLLFASPLLWLLSEALWTSARRPEEPSTVPASTPPTPRQHDDPKGSTP